MNVVGRALGSNYELISPLGSGAMGEVWLARHRTTGHEVAAKILRSEFTQQPAIVNRFIQERSILMSLDDPGIVRVLDVVVEGDQLAIVMEYVRGQDLRNVIRASGTVTPAIAAQLTAQVLDALAAAHKAGTVHRDVKPDNVLMTADWERAVNGQQPLDPYTTRLTDFGIAKLAQDSTVQATGLLGTPEYMPPELFTSGISSAAGDVYGAGVLAYELLAGRTPFAGPGNAFTIATRAVSNEPPPLPLTGPYATPQWTSLFKLVRSLLAKDPSRRPTAADAARSFHEAAAGLADQPALAPQPNPTNWHTTVDPALTGGPIRQQALAGDIDLGLTNIDAAPQVAKASPLVGPAAPQRLSPAPEASFLVPSETNIGAAPMHDKSGGIVTRAEAPTEVKKRSRWQRNLLISVGVITSLALVAAGFVFVPKMFAGTGGSSSPVSASLDDETINGSGLTITRSATYDADKKSIALKLTFKTGDAPLSGPFFQVLPRFAKGEQCPLASWDGADATANLTVATGITATCGYSMKVPPIEAKSKAVVTATIAATLTGDAEAKLTSWLQKGATETTAALANTGAANIAYPAQRLQGVQVEAPTPVSTRSEQLRVIIYPVWPTGVDALHPLFDSTIGTTTGLLDATAGGLDHLALFSQCDNAVLVNPDRSISILHATPSCTVTANIGALQGISSNEFQITASRS